MVTRRRASSHLRGEHNLAKHFDYLYVIGAPNTTRIIQATKISVTVDFINTRAFRLLIKNNFLSLLIFLVKR